MRLLCARSLEGCSSVCYRNLYLTSGLPGPRPVTPRACGARKNTPVAQFTLQFTSALATRAGHRHRHTDGQTDRRTDAAAFYTYRFENGESYSVCYRVG